MAKVTRYLIVILVTVLIAGILAGWTKDSIDKNVVEQDRQVAAKEAVIGDGIALIPADELMDRTLVVEMVNNFEKNNHVKVTSWSLYSAVGGGLGFGICVTFKRE